MKKLMFIVAVFALMAILTTNVFAVPTIAVYDSWGDTSGGEFLVLPGDFGFTPKSLGEVSGRFETFCLELSETINTSGTQYNALLGTAAVGGGGGAVGGSDPISDRTAYLYEQFITHNLANYHYSTVTGSDQIQRINSANALQDAIWYLEQEITTLPSGLATTFYDQSAAGVGQGIGTVGAINPYRASGSQAQSLLYSGSAIPAPGAILLGSIGVSIVGWLRRQRAL